METKNNAVMQVSDINQDVTKYLTAMGLVAKLNDKEKSQFVEICKAYQLNPFKREIYASKYGENLSIIVGFETYLKRAERTGLVAGWNVKTEGKISDNSLKAILTIHRKDWEHPFVHEVYYCEYVQKKNNGEITKFWKDKPITMTKKVAMSQGFRMCFSDELGGMPYTAEEWTEHEKQFAKYEELKKEDNIDVEISEIEQCKTLDELKSAWTKNKSLQKNVDFIQAKNAKKQELDLIIIEETKPQENETTTN